MRFRRATLSVLAALALVPLTGLTAAGHASTTPSVTQVVSDEAQARKELRTLEASFKGRIGAYAIDTATGKTVTYRAGERFPMLSTFKTIAAAAVLHKARTAEPGLMDKVVRWTAAEVKENSPVTEHHVEDGMTVAKLCEAAITRSDNTAGNMLLKQLGGPAGLTGYFRTLRTRSPGWTGGRPSSTTGAPRRGATPRRPRPWAVTCARSR